MPLCVGCGELASTLIVVVALATDLFFGLPLFLGSPALVRRKTPFAEEGTDLSKYARHVAVPSRK